MEERKWDQKKSVDNDTASFGLRMGTTFPHTSNSSNFFQPQDFMKFWAHIQSRMGNF